MRGSSLINWIDKNYLEGSNIIEYHLYDKDADEKYKKSIEKVNERNDFSKGKLTLKRELENYIPSKLYELEFEIDCSNIKDWNNDDVISIITSKTTKFNHIKKFKEKENIIKNITNSKITKSITKEHLIEMGNFEEMKSWFTDIKELYEK